MNSSNQRYVQIKDMQLEKKYIQIHSLLTSRLLAHNFAAFGQISMELFMVIPHIKTLCKV